MAEEMFYDKVAKKFGVAGVQAKYRAVYPEGHPEDLFEQKIVELSGAEKVALDVGSGKGEFTLHMAEHFRQIIGIDHSVESMKYAQQHQQEQGNTNAHFEIQDARNTTFAADTFDVVYTRRGPSFFHEYYRVAKPGGFLLMIGIGEKDAWDLKKIFGRGQGFWEWKTSALEQAEQQMQHEGFSIVYGQSFSYGEYYASFEDLNQFLQSVPIFQDYHSERDTALLDAYVTAFQRGQEIYLARQRYVVVARKPE